MKKIPKVLNKISSILGLFFVGLGLLLFVTKQMSPKNPENMPPENLAQKTTTASNGKQLATPTPKVIDYKAHFAIFTNGTFRIFTSSMYHNLDENIYISSKNPNTVQVKKENLTWQYFFNTLPIKLNTQCLTTGTGQEFCTKDKNVLRFFLNGNEDPEALSKIIQEDSTLLVTFGNLTENQIKTQLEKLQEIQMKQN